MTDCRPGPGGLPLPATGLPPASSRSAASNRATSRWNANTRTGRRCRDLYQSYLRQAGNPTEPATLAALMALAEQTVISEQARATCLADGGMNSLNLALVIRCENLSNRTLKRLKLDTPAKSPSKRKSFVETLEEREAARLAAEATVTDDQPGGGGA